MTTDDNDAMDLTDCVLVEALDFGDSARFHFTAAGVEGTCVLRLSSSLVQEVVREMDEQGTVTATQVWWTNNLVTGGILTSVKSPPTLAITRDGVARIQHGGYHFKFLVPFWSRWTFEYEDRRLRQQHGDDYKDPLTGCLVYVNEIHTL